MTIIPIVKFAITWVYCPKNRIFAAANYAQNFTLKKESMKYV